MNGERWPLENIRVLDLTWWVAGSEATRILASMGAEVIKVENRPSPDPTRFGSPTVRMKDEPTPEIRPLGYRNSSFGPNRSGIFNNLNPGKKGITLNVKHPTGHKLLEQLIAKSDVIIENFSADVMERWGLGYDVMKGIRSDIIYVSMSGLGHTGRNRIYTTMGPNVQALSGLTANSGQPGRPPSGWGFSYMDFLAGYFGAMAVMFGLVHRKRTCQGQYIDLSQVECGILLNSLAMVDYTANGQLPNQAGNRSQYGSNMIQGTYRCRGEDEWCSISVMNDNEEEWSRFCKALENPAWTGRFKDGAARSANQDELDSLLEAWTRERTAQQVQDILQANGIAAGKMQSAAEQFDSPQLKSRNFFVPLKNSEIGEWPVFQIPIRSRRRKMSVGGLIGRGSPTLGEDNTTVLKELLGLDPGQIEQYSKEGVI
ncbi:MAG: CaiB/BaiF CoA transferase family protein [Nitrososphaerales archaeon]